MQPHVGVARHRAVGALAAVLLGSLVVTACSSREDTQRLPPIQHGSVAAPTSQSQDPPVDFTGTTLDGKVISLSDYRGHVVFVDVWATWCEPCVEEMVVLARVARRKPSARVIGIDVLDDKDKANAFVRDHQIPFPIVFDPSKTVVSQVHGLFSGSLPAGMFVDRDGHMFVTSRLTADQLETYFETL